MDQLRTFLAQVKKYHFWILCVIVVLVGLTSWYLATSSLDAQSKANAAKIKAAADKVTQVKGIPNHPNADFDKGMEEIVKTHARSVGKGWEFRYKQQEKRLVWPSRLGREFLKYAERLRPIEQFELFNDKDGYQQDNLIPVKFREQYRNFIELELPELASVIGAKWEAKPGEGGSSGSGPGGGKSSYGSASKGSTYAKTSSRGPGGTGSQTGTSGEEEEETPTVFWDISNQQDLLSAHFPFTAENASPHTLDVLYAQEDLWVLTAIIGVIKRTNGDADANYNAAIKEIQSIEMGRTVRGRMGKVSELEGYETAGSGTGIPGSGMPTAPGGPNAMTQPGIPAAPGDGMTTGPGTNSAPVDPAMGRYVDIDYNALPPKKLREARTSTDPELAIYSVAKRMPVRIRVVMDQRKLATLLAECGNSSLPIEVRQVRINCEAGLENDNGSGASRSSATSTGANYSGAASFGASGSKKSSSSSSRSSRSSSRGGSYGAGGAGQLSGGNNQTTLPDPNEVEIEVYGIVHLYNPENKKQLKDVDWVNEVVAPTAATTTTEAPRG